MVPYIERLASLPDGLNYVLAVLIIVGVLLYELYGGEQKSKSTPTVTAQPPTQ